MPTTMEAIFENGVLKPLAPVGLKEHHKYKVSLEESEDSDQDWLTAPLPGLGNIVFHEDPSLPLNPADWPEEPDADPS